MTILTKNKGVHCLHLQDIQNIRSNIKHTHTHVHDEHIYLLKIV